MPASTGTLSTMGQPDPTLSLYRLLTPQVRADPYPLYERLRTEDPVHWDPFLHAWVVTRYADVVAVLHDVRFSAHRTPTPEHLTALGLGALGPIGALLTAEHEGDRLSEDEVIANVIITMVGGQETTTSMIGNGLLTLLRHPG